ncbi:hypothetical protein VTN02DRAFT_3181 [Thermoascus thermophilus]
MRGLEGPTQGASQVSRLVAMAPLPPPSALIVRPCWTPSSRSHPGQARDKQCRPPVRCPTEGLTVLGLHRLLKSHNVLAGRSTAICLVLVVLSLRTALLLPSDSSRPASMLRHGGRRGAAVASASASSSSSSSSSSSKTASSTSALLPLPLSPRAAETSASCHDHDTHDPLRYVHDPPHVDPPPPVAVRPSSPRIQGRRSSATEASRPLQQRGRSLISSLRVAPSSRLWNPVNHVPRTTLVPVPVPAPRPLQLSDDPRDAHPLLTVLEQRRSRQTPSPSSLLVERSVGEAESGRTSVALPPAPSRSGGPWGSARRGDMAETTTGDATTEDDNNSLHPPEPAHLRPEGSGRRGGPDEGALVHPRHVPSQQSLRSLTYASVPSGTGINAGGGEADVADELAWGPAHPCFPHPNPHVPIDSDEYETTRIIRIRRDWMLRGDLAPTFSNLYPEILDPLLPEQEFRRIIAKINTELIKAFDPFSLHNWVDAALGLLTGWVWEDLGATAIKRRLKSLEDWIEDWNREVGAREGVRIWSLRRTAYMSLDIQIPDPKVGLVGSDVPSIPGTRPSSRGGPGTL